MQKFPGQGLNPRHNSNLNHSLDNAGSLTCCATRKLHTFFFFLRWHLWHMEVPRLGVKSELQLPAYTTATATRDLSHISNLCCSLWQCQIFNPLSEARDRTHILMDTMCVLNLLSHKKTSILIFGRGVGKGEKASLLCQAKGVKAG